MSKIKNFFRRKENKKLTFIILVVLVLFSYLAFLIYDEYFSFDDISNDKLISEDKIKKEFADEYIESFKYQIKKNEVLFTGISFNNKHEGGRKFRFIVGKKEYEKIIQVLSKLGKGDKGPKIQQVESHNNFPFFPLLEIFILLCVVYYFYSSKTIKVTYERGNIFFRNIAGYEEEKKEMKKIVSFLKKPEIFSSIGAKLPKGVLFSGSPGVGKTLLAKAIASEANVPFYYSSGSEFDEVFAGLGASRVRKLFNDARENAPCVIFIDEIDSIGKTRSNSSNNLSDQTLNQFLVELDGFKENSGIIVIAATNRVDTLDKALIRSGRFDKIIFIPLPNKNDREEIFKIHSKNKRIASDVNFKELSSMTTGLSGADIENIMNEAAILDIKKKNKEITFSNINEAIDRKILGLEKKSFVISKKEKQIIAFHESGHAIIGLNLPNSDKVQKVSIISRAQTGGHVSMSQNNDKLIYTKDEMFSRIVGYLGGRASEELFFGENDISSGASNDIEISTYLARLMVVNFGMSKKLGLIKYKKNYFFENENNFNFSEQTAREIDQEVKKIIDSAYEKALLILKEKKEDVKLIAETLLEKEVITFKQIECLLKSKKKSIDKKKNESEEIAEKTNNKKTIKK